MDNALVVKQLSKVYSNFELKISLLKFQKVRSWD